MQISPILRPLFVTTIGMMLASCSNTATIRYQYRYAFKEGFTKGGDSIKAGADEHFALYHIVCIAAGDTDFTFTPSKLYTTNPGATVNNALNDEYGIVAPVTVQAGQEKQNVGRVILRLKGGWAGNQAEPLFYNSSSFSIPDGSSSSSKDSVLMSNDGFPNSAGPTMSSDTLDGEPAYEQGANLCKDPPIQAQH